MFKRALIIAAFLAAATTTLGVTPALAWDCPAHQTQMGTHANPNCVPDNQPPVTKPPPPRSLPPPQLPPSGPASLTSRLASLPSHSNVLFCVQTTDYGWTTVQADEKSFSPGGQWLADYYAGTTVKVGGKTVTLAGPVDDPTGATLNGVTLAPFVEGVGYTCDQPWVTGTPATIRLR